MQVYQQEQFHQCLPFFPFSHYFDVTKVIFGKIGLIPFALALPSQSYYGNSRPLPSFWLKLELHSTSITMLLYSNRAEPCSSAACCCFQPSSPCQSAPLGRLPEGCRLSAHAGRQQRPHHGSSQLLLLFTSAISSSSSHRQSARFLALYSVLRTAMLAAGPVFSKVASLTLFSVRQLLYCLPLYNEGLLHGLGNSSSQPQLAALLLLLSNSQQNSLCYSSTSTATLHLLNTGRSTVH